MNQDGQGIYLTPSNEQHYQRLAFHTYIAYPHSQADGTKDTMLSVRLSPPMQSAEPHPLFSPTHASPVYSHFKDTLDSPSLPKDLRFALMLQADTEIFPFKVLSPVNTFDGMQTPPRVRSSNCQRQRTTILASCGQAEPVPQQYAGAATLHKHPNAIPDFQASTMLSQPQSNDRSSIHAEDCESSVKAVEPECIPDTEWTPVVTPRTAKPLGLCITRPAGSVPPSM